MNEAMKRFQEKNNWSKYVLKQKHKRAQKLKEAGVLNVWNVINKQATPKYAPQVKLLCQNRVTMPLKIVEKLGLKRGVKFTVEITDEGILFKVIKDENME